MTQRELIAQARTYLGVKWRHQGNTRDGCDCVGLLVSIGRDFGITVEYPTNYHHKPSDRLFLDRILEFCDPIAMPYRQPGDFLFFRNPRDRTWHVAVQTEVGMLHSTVVARRVVEHRIDQEWLLRLRAVYRFKELGVVHGS